MLLLNRERLESWLKVTNRNPAWLARELNMSRAYVSLIMANKCKMSTRFVSDITMLTKIPFEVLFHQVAQGDDREFYGSSIYFQGRMVESKNYRTMLDRFKQKHVQKNFVDTVAA